MKRMLRMRLAGGALSGLMALSAVAQTEPPLYVQIAMHNEESSAYHTDTNLFWSEREQLVAFAGMLASNGVMFNWMSDWKFLAGVTNFDRGTATTGGSNVVVWLRGLGFEVDPHAHETSHNYADVAYGIAQCGVEPSQVVGGHVAYPPTSAILDHVRNPITGQVFTSYVWTPAILWGGGTGSHRDETNLWISGIWKPQDTNFFLRHDEGARLPNVGTYGGTNVRWTNLSRLIALRADGRLSTNRLYTCLLMANQRDLTPAFVSDFESRLRVFTNIPNLRWVGITQTVGIWRTNYNAQPNLLPFDLSGDVDNDGLNDGWEFTNRTDLSWNSDDNPGGHDFDGDGRADPAVVRNGTWLAWLSGSGYAAASARFSITTGTPLAGDLDGDGLADPVLVERGVWHIWRSLAGYEYARVDLGVTNGSPLLADFDGDGRSDPALWVDGDGYVWRSGSDYGVSGPTRTATATGATPLVADFDGDERADWGVVRGAEWTVWLSASAYAPSGPYDLTLAGDTPSAGDYDGDGRADPVTTRSGDWYLWLSGSQYRRVGPYRLDPSDGVTVP